MSRRRAHIVGVGESNYTRWGKIGDVTEHALACQAIQAAVAELEMEGRGYYTGSMGYLGRDGSLDLNILIRSMLVQDKLFSFRTGGGIVADSVAEHEVRETQDKARGMLLAIEAHSRET